ncbi:phospho-sugar mutase [Salinibacterium sp. NSLL150]|uniref:phospho-sugar mutase n=1 Tax=unclassified Salinibacterium TaxID=2632331 RepID=UPI0018CF2879|nr:MULTISPECIES: phospho-sugar mutase [unclassified Salinibacterium]MBH0099741.1 phospho-sugar mutase [Salinibacterium sp. NSLL35]MBH0102495.1 phospho-sugar mutase [Salinibacterium sp. NSLL150]MBH0105255.1 phospho-sugar mutase [Salinibacterium sp. NSLL16]MBH0108015.1 phospho-sugar mutase [Salinibacterium sp. NSLL17]
MSTEILTTAELIAAANAWLEQDPDAVTHTELEALITDAAQGDETAIAGLHDRFDSRLAFGTAGLRGELGAGPNRMNRVLVTQAAAGLAAYLLTHELSPSIVIGYDGRINSEVFARDTATIMAGAGVRAILLPRLLPTPVLAFAVRHLNVSAGVMVTASHNPAIDNGYKVYLGGDNHGSQIVPPADADIAHAIDLVAKGSIADLPRSTDFVTTDEGVVDEYIALTAALAGPVKDVVYTYTAMHGVGWETSKAVYEKAGFAAPALVEEQAHPDAAFPTVAFPNPEEPGAMDLSFAKAREVGADLAIAHDPDADRLAVAVPGRDGEWRRLSGNEVGILLGWRAAERANGHGVLAASIVSSPALRAIAAGYDLDYTDTLTGFKWISRIDGLVFGYEEALGYLVDPAKVRDKDGISASVDFLSMAAELKADGKTVLDRLDEFAARFGAFASRQVSLRFAKISEIGETMTRLRANAPAAVGGLTVASFDDFENGVDGFAPSNIIRMQFEGGARVIVRPSGTEPKLKFYVDASSMSGEGAERQAAAEAVASQLEAGMREVLS